MENVGEFLRIQAALSRKRGGSWGAAYHLS
jgi:hypothetical protein